MFTLSVYSDYACSLAVASEVTVYNIITKCARAAVYLCNDISKMLFEIAGALYNTVYGKVELLVSVKKANMFWNFCMYCSRWAICGIIILYKCIIKVFMLKIAQHINKQWHLS